MGTVDGRLLRNRQIKGLDDGLQQHIYWRRFWDPPVDAAAEYFDQRHVGARRVCQDRWRGHNSVQLVEKNQPAQVLNGVGILTGAGPHCVARMRAEGNENIGDHQIELRGMECLYGFFDRRDDDHFGIKSFGHSPLHHIHVLRLVVDE